MKITLAVSVHKENAPKKPQLDIRTSTTTTSFFQMLLLGAVVACAMAEDPEAKSEGYGKDLGGEFGFAFCFWFFFSSGCDVPFRCRSAGKYDGYFQYANVPSPYEYEFGYNRGNPAHFTSRYEQAKEGRFRTKVRRYRCSSFDFDGYFFFGFCYLVTTGQVGRRLQRLRRALLRVQPRPLLPHRRQGSRQGSLLKTSSTSTLS